MPKTTRWFTSNKHLILSEAMIRCINMRCTIDKQTESQFIRQAIINQVREESERLGEELWHAELHHQISEYFDKLMTKEELLIEAYLRDPGDLPF